MNYKVNKSVSIENVEGNTILITEQGDAAVLNETGEMIFSSINAGASEEESARMVANKYGEDVETVKADVEELLVRLTEADFITPLIMKA